VLTPTLLPNLLLATRTALFPANARPTSQIAAVNIGAPASAPQSVQAPTSNQKAFTPSASPGAPITEGIRGPGINAIGKTNGPGISNSGNSCGPISTTGHPASLSAIAADVPTLNVPTEPEKSNCPTQTEIAAIKRRCATSLLAVMPRTIARTFFGVPSSAPRPPYSGDGTCSNTSTCSTNNSPPDTSSLTPSINSEDRSTSQGNSILSSSHSSAPSTCPVVEGGYIAAERLRTDKQSAEIDLEETHLLETIEDDLLDVFADQYCNKHLVYSIIEVVLAKVLPEMTERSVKDLMEDRGVASVPPTF
jgi:hypothetical protein